MSLRQGCHKRTPWWCWLTVLLLAATALPGAALWVEAQDRPSPAADQGERHVAQQVLPATSSGGATADLPLVTRTYDVEDLLQAAQAELGEAARALLTTLVRSSSASLVNGNAASGVQFDDLPSVEPLADKLVVRTTERGHARIAAQLATLRKHGFAQLAIEVRIVSGPAVAAPNAAAPNWQLIGGSAPASRPDEQSQAASEAGTFGAAVSIVERNLPAMLGIIDDAGVKELLDAVQADRRSNVLFAPKVILFNGQSARVEDSVQRPFVVGVKPKEGGGHEPQVRVVTEGTTIRLRPELQSEGSVTLDFGLTLSEVRSVDEASFPVGDKNEMISVQVPEVATTRVESAVKMNVGETLAIHVPATSKRSKKDQAMCVLLTVRTVEAAKTRKHKAAAPTGSEASHDDSNDRVVAWAAPQPRVSESGLVERIYAVADLVVAPPMRPLKPAGIDKPSNKWPGPRNVDVDSDSLIVLMTATISPDSWSSRGGTGTVSVLPNRLSLLVRQTSEVHDRIADLFEQLRRLQDVQIVSSVMRVEMSQAELERWVANTKQAELGKLAARERPVAVLSTEAWEESSTVSKPKELRQLPRITAFNGQTFDFGMADGSAPEGVLPSLRIQPVATADFRAIRISVGPGSPTDKDASPDDESPMQSMQVPHDHVLLVDLDTLSWDRNGHVATSGSNRRFCLIQPRIMVVTDRPYARVLSSRPEK